MKFKYLYICYAKPLDEIYPQIICCLENVNLRTVCWLTGKNLLGHLACSCYSCTKNQLYLWNTKGKWLLWLSFDRYLHSNLYYKQRNLGLILVLFSHPRQKTCYLLGWLQSAHQTHASLTAINFLINFTKAISNLNLIYFILWWVYAAEGSKDFFAPSWETH